MARRYVTLSDLTGREIKDGEAAELRVLSHPLIERPVKIDAQALEVANLKGKDELVEIELVLPSTPPEKLVVDLAAFDKLFKNGSADDVLGSAERYYPGSDDAPRRRGRPRKDSTTSSAPKVKRDPALLNAMRDWARQNGYPDLGSRGRIPLAAEQAFEAAHQSSE